MTVPTGSVSARTKPLGYVVIEWNQASGRPSLADDLLWDEPDLAQFEAERATENSRRVGRLETFTVTEVRAETAEAEIARLEQLVTDWDDLATVLRNRAEAADAEIARLRAECQRTRDEWAETENTLRANLTRLSTPLPAWARLQERAEALAARLQATEQALEVIAGRECERFTDADPRECVETKREPCLRCVALAAILEGERITRRALEGAAE